MTTTIDSTALFFGAPASLTVDGTEVGATVDAPKVSIEATQYAPEFQGAAGPISGAVFTTKIKASATFTVNEITATKLAWSLPGSTSTSSESVGQPVAGLDTTLAADPALGATNLKVASVTTVNIGDFIRVAAAGVAATEANSEILRVLTVGTTGGGGTGCDVENSAGGGCLLDHANAEEVKTVSGHVLAASVAAGATNIKVDAVTGFVQNDYVRIGYVGHYETRKLTAVGTAGAGGTGLTFAIPLTMDHAQDEWVVEVTSLGTTTTTWKTGRVASANFKDVVLTGVGVDNRQLIVTITDALADGKLDIEMSDNAVAGSTVTMTGYVDGAVDATLAPFSIEVG